MLLATRMTHGDQANSERIAHHARQEGDLEAQREDRDETQHEDRRETQREDERKA